MPENINNQLQVNRDAIDRLDKAIVQRLNQRVLQDAGADECEVLKKIAKLNSGPLTGASLQAIYQTLMIAGLAPEAVKVKASIADALDSEIVTLFNERVTHAGAIGKIKHASGADYYDPTREAQVMEAITVLNHGPISDATLRSVYREIISGSISLEKKLNIAYLGPEATYTHQAAISNFGVSLNYEAIRSIPDVFAAVQIGSADYGVIPIENSTEGVVFHSMDTLVESELQICSQVYLPIEHCLISHSKMDAIKSVRSKDQALGQCRDWLKQNVPTAVRVDVSSTADAVRTASENHETAAIASHLSAMHYNVPIQARGIQDREDNVTRFLVIGKTHAKPLGLGRDKTSLVISLKDEVGALERALHAFASRGINLSKIESRPSRKKAWDYLFFIDCSGHFEDKEVQAALNELNEHCSFVKWLGSYPD